MLVRIVTSIALALLIACVYFQVDNALRTIREHAPKPKETVKIGGDKMSQIDALCHKLFPKHAQREKVGYKIHDFLVCGHYERLVPILFILASLTGWCASVWLSIFQHHPAVTGESVLVFICSILLAFVVGLVCYLLVELVPFKLPMNKFDPGGILLFPLLGGLFMKVFFDRLPRLLLRIFDYLGVGRNGGPVGNVRNIVLMFVTGCTFMSTNAQAQKPLDYFRCVDPTPPVCLAFNEGDKKVNCPKCIDWRKMFLNFSEVMSSALAAQKAADVQAEHVASNFFLNEAAKKLFECDAQKLIVRAPKTSYVRSNPQQYGYRELRKHEPKKGALVVIGNIAGIADEKSGELVVAYPSEKTGRINFESPTILGDSESADVKYFTLAETNR